MLSKFHELHFISSKNGSETFWQIKRLYNNKFIGAEKLFLDEETPPAFIHLKAE